MALLSVVATTGGLVYERSHPAIDTSVSLAAYVVQIVCAVLLALLVVVEHFKTISPSTLIIAYTFVKALFSAVLLRTYIESGLPRGGIIMTALVTSSYIGLFSFELAGKSHILRNKAIPKMVTSNILSRSLYLWLLPLLWYGHKTTLTIEDCGVIPVTLTVNSTGTLLHVAFLAKVNHTRRILRASLAAFPMLFLAPILPRILLLLSTFAQPLLVSKMIEFISDPAQPSEKGSALVGAFVCIYASIALMTSIYWEKVFDSTVRYRAALADNIYTKTLRLSSASANQVGGGVASTYM